MPEVVRPEDSKVLLLTWKATDKLDVSNILICKIY